MSKITTALCKNESAAVGSLSLFFVSLYVWCLCFVLFLSRPVLWSCPSCMFFVLTLVYIFVCHVLLYAQVMWAADASCFFVFSFFFVFPVSCSFFALYALFLLLCSCMSYLVCTCLVFCFNCFCFLLMCFSGGGAHCCGPALVLGGCSCTQWVTTLPCSIWTG